MKRPFSLSRYDRVPAVRTALFIAGVGIVIVSPVIGAIPGPGGVFVFAAGFGMMLRYSNGTKRVYTRAKRRWPRMGAWIDWGLRRASARRRAAKPRPALGTD